MQKEQVLTALYNSKEFNKALGNVDQKQLVDDLKQEVFLVLCNLPDERFKKICASNNGKGLLYFAMATLRNMAHGKRSTFHRSHVKKVNKKEYLYHLTLTPLKGLEIKAKDITRLVRELPWYNRTLLELYVECKGSTKLMSEKTGIQARAIRYNLAKSRVIIKEKAKKL